MKVFGLGFGVFWAKLLQISCYKIIKIRSLNTTKLKLEMQVIQYIIQKLNTARYKPFDNNIICPKQLGTFSLMFPRYKIDFHD